MGLLPGAGRGPVSPSVLLTVGQGLQGLSPWSVHGPVSGGFSGCEVPGRLRVVSSDITRQN